MTFSFLKWREWSNAAALELQNEGFRVKVRSNDLRLPSTGLELTGRGILANFRSFENCLVDYEVIALPADVLLANEAMIVVNDDNFEAVFAKFREFLDAGLR